MLFFSLSLLQAFLVGRFIQMTDVYKLWDSGLKGMRKSPIKYSSSYKPPGTSLCTVGMCDPGGKGGVEQGPSCTLGDWPLGRFLA